MDCFSRYCLNKQKQPIKATNPPINNAPIINGPSFYSAPNLPANNVPLIPSSATIQNGGLHKSIYNNVNGYSSQDAIMSDKEITQKIVGWAEEKTQKQKKFDRLGQTIYIIQIGKSKPLITNVTNNRAFNQWAAINLYNQFSNQPRRYSIPMTNVNFQQKKFPDPFIRYKIMPQLNQTMTLDVATQNNPQKKLTRGNLIVWDYHGGPNQHFYIRQSRQKGVYYFVCVSTGFVLTIQNSKDSYRKEITPISASPHEDRPQQLWRLKHSQNSSYIIQSFAFNNMVMDLYKQRAQNDTPVILWQQTKKQNQRWIILSG